MCRYVPLFADMAELVGRIQEERRLSDAQAQVAHMYMHMHVHVRSEEARFE